MQSNTTISQSPSFDTYSSSNRLALIAARVVHEFQSHADLDDYLSDHETNSNYNHEKDEELNKINDDDEDEEFEFACVSKQSDLLSDGNGLIAPVYPLFDTNLLLNEEEVDPIINSAIVSDSPPVRLPLRKLFSEERERDSPSCSSSEADELDRVPAEMYCVWKPNTANKSPDKISKKSNSTGSSKRWKFRDLLRSNSEGKDSFVFLTNPIKRRETTNKIKSEKDVKVSGKVNDVSGEVPATLEYRLRKERVKEDDQRRMVVPYKKDIVGMFADVNGVSRNLRPF